MELPALYIVKRGCDDYHVVHSLPLSHVHNLLRVSMQQLQMEKCHLTWNLMHGTQPQILTRPNLQGLLLLDYYKSH